MRSYVGAYNYVITTHTTHKIKIPWMIHHIQTKKQNLVATNYKNSSPKNTKQNPTKNLHNAKKTIITKLMWSRISIHEKWFENHTI
jgi:hypothetical protein